MLSISQDAKTVKGEKYGYLTGVLYLAPHKLAGRNMCPNASPGCIADCLNTAGRGAFNSVQKARIAKTKAFWSDGQGFLDKLEIDLVHLIGRAKDKGLVPLARLNGTSDVAWEYVRFLSHYDDNGNAKPYPNMMARFPDLQFYDYTKSFKRMMNFLDGRLPKNYHLTFSRSECNQAQCWPILDKGGNVAVVFSTKKGEALPKEWKGYKVIDGDTNDIRPKDQKGRNAHGANGAASVGSKGVIVGLRAKGRARRDTTGFVVQV